MSTQSNSRLPTLFIPHGGGPCFFMENPRAPHMWDKMAGFLRGLAASIGTRPKGIVVVSGHWEQAEFTVNANPQPPLLFDYYGFPEHTYRLEYPAPGSPELARRVLGLLSDAGIPAGMNTERGLDHGVFIPFMLIYPDADIPIVQLSMKAGLDPAAHIRAGQALSALRDEGVLIVGSGMSFHNMRGFGDPRFLPPSRRFDAWLENAVSQADAETRNTLLEQWGEAPDGRTSHPHPDHLLPLMVAAGAAGADSGHKIFEDEVLGVIVSGFAFSGNS